MLDYPARGGPGRRSRICKRRLRCAGPVLQDWRLDGPSADLQVFSEKDDEGQGCMGLWGTDAGPDVLKLVSSIPAC
jgi:hypothetical protein